MKIKPNRRRFEIAFYLLTGWTPWGVHLDRDAGDRKPMARPVKSIGGGPEEWPICCGCVLTTTEVADWKAAGLLVDGDPVMILDPHGPAGDHVPRIECPTVVAGPGLDAWVGRAWVGMKARRWAADFLEPPAADPTTSPPQE